MICYETDTFRYEITDKGASYSLVDKRDDIDYLADGSRPLMWLIRNGVRHDASGVQADGERLLVSFAGTDVTGTLDVRPARDWLILELSDLSDDSGVEEVGFVDLRLNVPEHGREISPLACCVRSPQAALACQTLDLLTNTAVDVEGDTASLTASCYAKFGLIGARAALIAAPSDRFLEVVEQLEIAENLPHPTIDGHWSRFAPGARDGYFFIDLTEANADHIIDQALRLRLPWIITYWSMWATSRGTYAINPKTYPNGMAGLKAVADKVHAAGLKMGIHCLTGFISKFDPLVSPTPDPRLAKDDSVTLAAGIGAADNLLTTVESPGGFPDDVAFGIDRQGFDVQVDSEIITYTRLSTKSPFGLLECKRGAHGTEATAHEEGAQVWHLTQRFNNYLVDCDTDLADEVAQRYADVINDAGLDMIYFDGAKSNIAFGEEWAWHYVPYIPLLSARLWKRKVRMGGSCDSPLLWHLKCFRTCNDFVEIAVKRFFDSVKLSIALPAMDDFVPIDFGWWGLHSWAPNRRATTPDEIEYVCQKALAWGESWSLETHVEKIESCGRWADIEPLIATYEDLRRANTIPKAVCDLMREPGAEYKLVGSESEGRELVPCRYDPSHLVTNDDTASWTIDNDLSAQPLRFRLYALPELEAYESDANPVLADQMDPTCYSRTRTREDCHTQLNASDDRTPSGEPCVEFCASSNAPDDGGWVEHRLDLADIGADQVVTALIEGVIEDTSVPNEYARSLAVWVYGDGSGAVLNVQLQSGNGGYRDHYVDLDFSGWRYCELTRPETDRVYTFDAGYSTKHATRHFHYGQLMKLYLRYNSIPPQSDVRCLIGPVKALREHWRPLQNPSFTVGERTVRFPCALETEQYIEFDGDGEATRFDCEGVMIERVAAEGEIPLLQPGKNHIHFHADSDGMNSRLADITVIRLGQRGET